jgi:hypothetical protein
MATEEKVFPNNMRSTENLFFDSDKIILQFIRILKVNELFKIV